jgi:hypothetical protein
MRRVSRVVLLALAVVAFTSEARAQLPPSAPAALARFVTDLIAAGAIVDAAGPGIDATNSNERRDFFVPAQFAGMPAQLNQALGFQLATFPLDMGLNTSKPGSEYVPSHYGFGPAFTVHAGSVGRGKWSASFNYQNVSFGSIDGIGLDSGQLGFALKAPASIQSQFGREVLYQSLTLRVQQDVATLGIVYGATDRVDIGIGIPLVHLELEGQVRSQIFPPGPSPVPGVPSTFTHYFDVYPVTPTDIDGCSATSVDVVEVPQVAAGPTLLLTDMVRQNARVVGRRCSASGLGDIVAHARVRLTSSETNALGVSIDARLPTGDEDQLLGTGGTRTTGALVWSGRAGRLLPHANVGYTFSVGNGSALFNTVPTATGPAASPTPLDLSIPDEIEFAGGTDVVVARRFTFGIDAFGRRIQDLRRVRIDSTTAAALTPGDPAVPGTLLQSDGLGATLLVGVGAAQVALTDRTVLKANIMFPLFGDGLRTRIGFGAGLGIRY